jgi:hypothetical protein
VARDQFQLTIHPRFVNEVMSDPDKVQTMIKCGSSFREFLNHWHFVDQEAGKDKLLGEHIWHGQEQAIEAMENVDKFYSLKARKLGFTTLEIAYDAWCARFRDENARVHLFSRRDDAAKELLTHVKYGMSRLPEWMQLPLAKKPTQNELEYQAGPNDKRLVKSYPTGEETAVEATCTHGHVDEWARMNNPESVWQAIEPSMAKSCHIITTGRGPINFSAQFWRKCLAGDTAFVPIFISALNRPDRDKGWLEQKRRSLTEEAFRQEFPMTWEDALFAGGRFTFRSVDVSPAGMGVGPQEAAAGHKYVKAWDIGRHKDAAVGVVIDVTCEPMQVVEYVRVREMPYPALQRTIVRLHKAYPGPTVIEKNNAGEAVYENLEGVRESEFILFNTSKSSKARIIEELQLALEGRGLQWSADDWPQLDNEVRGYQVPDDNIIQDSVMALAIANAHTATPYSAGRIGVVSGW